MLVAVDGFPDEKYADIVDHDLQGGKIKSTNFRIDSISKHYTHEHKSSKSGVSFNKTLLSIMITAIRRWFQGLVPLWTISIEGYPLMVVTTFDHFAYLRGCANQAERKYGENYMPKVSDKE